jgi:hypothetical protein
MLASNANDLAPPYTHTPSEQLVRSYETIFSHITCLFLVTLMPEATATDSEKRNQIPADEK